MTLILTTAGAVLTTLLGVLVGGALTSRSQHRQWSRDRQADACAQVLRESSNMLIDLAILNGHTVNPAPEGVGVSSSLNWRPWNEALALVNLIAEPDIVEAAHAIDAEFWPVHSQVKRGWTAEGDWFRLRDLIESRRQDFINVARRRLALSGAPLQRFSGRPTSGDPIWQYRRSYFSSSQGSGVDAITPPDIEGAK